MTLSVEDTQTERRRFTLLPRPRSIGELNDPRRSVVAFSNRFHDARQYMYFLHFQEKTAHVLSGSLEEGLWTQVSLQASQHEPMLLDLITAAAAIDLNRNTPTNSIGVTTHKYQGLIHYDQALRSMQKRITDAPPRTLMIAALLIFYIEIINGDVNAACKQIRSVLPIMHQELSLRGYKYRHCEQSSSTIDLEDSLVAAFIRLDNSLCANPDVWTDSVLNKPVLKVDYSVTLPLPAEFTSFHQARNYLEMIQYHNLPSMTKGMANLANSKTNHDPETTRHLHEKLKLYQEWRRCYNPLYLKTGALGSPSSSRQDQLIAAPLWVQNMAGILMVESLLPQPASQNLSTLHYDCLEVLELSRRIAQDPSYIQSFTFGYSVIPGVFFVLLMRADALVKRQALELLASVAERKDGFAGGEWYWASKFLGFWKMSPF